MGVSKGKEADWCLEFLEEKTVGIKEEIKTYSYILLVAIMVLTLAIPASAQDAKHDAAAELAKKLANPVSELISVPIQYNYDENYGPDDKGSVHRMNIQPVIPVTLNDQWNLITRTIVPLISQNDVPLNEMDASGLGDIMASQFFSPKEPTAGGWIWGVGPVELIPSATDELVGGEKWGVGPTGVVLRQAGPWTVGLLANHIWSVGGHDDRASVNATYLQPFVSYITRTKTTFGIYTESTYDWKAEQWAVPVIAQVSQLFKIGPQILQMAVGAKYWAEAPDNGPEGWGLRAQLTFLFPK